MPSRFDTFRGSSSHESRQADLFLADLLGTAPPRRRRPSGRYGEDDPKPSKEWTLEQERIFKEWWKKIGGFEVVRAVKSIAANKATAAARLTGHHGDVSERQEGHEGTVQAKMPTSNGRGSRLPGA